MGKKCKTIQRNNNTIKEQESNETKYKHEKTHTQTHPPFHIQQHERIVRIIFPEKSEKEEEKKLNISISQLLHPSKLI